MFQGWGIKLRSVRNYWTVPVNRVFLFFCLKLNCKVFTDIILMCPLISAPKREAENAHGARDVEAEGAGRVLRQGVQGLEG